MINYQLIRSERRKTLGLQVKAGKVYVRAPSYVSKEFIHDFVAKKSSWLKAKVNEQVNVDDGCLSFEQGSKVLFQGELLTLVIDFAPKRKTFIKSNKLGSKYLVVILANRQKEKAQNVKVQALLVKKQLEEFYKEQALSIIPLRLAQLSELTSLKPVSFKIRQYKSRWGSCNSRGELSFNYLLMMVPNDILDYVIIHELCHLKYLNHSTRFWQLVSCYFPEYVEAKRWFKEHQAQLQWLTP